MNRRIRCCDGGLGIGSVLLLIFCTADSFADPSDNSTHQQQLLARRDQLDEESYSAHAEGDWDTALRLQGEALRIERRLFGENDNEILDSLDYLQYLTLVQEGAAEAVKVAKQRCEVASAVYGDRHWRTTTQQRYLRVLKGVAAWEVDKQRRLQRLERKFIDVYYAASDESLPFEQRRKLNRDSIRAGEQLNALLSDLTPASGGTMADNLAFMSECYERIGEYEKAARALDRAVRLISADGAHVHPDNAYMINRFAALYESIGDYAKAEPLYRQALEFGKEAIGEKNSYYANYLNNLAALYLSTGDYARAEPLYLRALEIDEQTIGKEHADFATHLNNLAALYASMGEHAKAEPRYLQVLEIDKLTIGESHPRFAEHLNSLAALYESTGEYTKAEPLYLQTLAIDKESLGEGHPDYAVHLNNLAMLYRSMGDYAKPESLFRRVLEIDKQTIGQSHPNYATHLNNLGVLYALKAEHEKAEPFLSQALAIAQHNFELTTTIQSERQQLAMAASLRHFLDAYLTLAAATEELDEEAYRHLLTWKGAVLSAQRAVRAVVDRSELMPLYRELQIVTRDLAGLAFSTPDPSTKNDWQEDVARLSQRKEALESQLASKSAAFRQATCHATLKELREALPGSGVLVDFIEVRNNRSQNRRMFAFVVRGNSPVTLLDLGEVTPLADAISLWRSSFGQTDRSQAAGQLLREKVWLPIETALKQRTSGAGVRKSADRTAAQSPRATTVDKDKAGPAPMLLVSPDGVLARMPIGALPGSKPGTYLLEEWSIAVTPAPQILPLLLQQKTTGTGLNARENSLLLVGGVNYDSRPLSLAESTNWSLLGQRRTMSGEAPRFSFLSGTLHEVESIKKKYRDIWRDRDVTLFTAERATETALRREAPQHRYLHLATHGFFASEHFSSALDRSAGTSQPGTQFVTTQSISGYHPSLLSGVALAGANEPDVQRDDGILTAAEVQSLDLRGVELSVLSACETGLGKTAGGEGLLGLQRAFQVAGARTTIASLWRVHDQATQLLMTRFYENLWQQKMGKLEALREAQLWMLRDAAKLKPDGTRGLTELEESQPISKTGRLPPYYWAAFVLSGDWR